MLVRESIKETHNIRDINKLTHSDTMLVLDLDNVTFTRELGGDAWFMQSIDHACRIIPDKEEAIALVITLYHALQHHVRVKEVDPAIIKIIKTLQDIGVPVIALTARSKEIIKPTLIQLHDIGIDFSNYKTQSSKLKLGDNKSNQCCYLNGIIYCSGNDKGKCLSAFLASCQSLPKHIVMVDDKLKHLESVKQAVEKFNIRFDGLRYGLLDEQVKQHNQKAAHIELSQILHKLPEDAKKAAEKLKLISEEKDVLHELKGDGFFDKSAHQILEKKPLIMEKKLVLSRSASVPSMFKPQSRNPVLFRQNTFRAIQRHGTDPDIFEGQPYQMLTHDLPITPSSQISCRGNDRESILLNMKSPVLQKIFDEFINHLTQDSYDSDKTPPYVSISNEPLEADNKFDLPPPYDLDLLQRINSYVQSHLKLISEEKIKQLISTEMKEIQSKYALLEWFWKHQSGYCRHYALATAHLLVSYIDYYAKQNGKCYADTDSRVYRFRTQIPSIDKSKPAMHAVVIYEAENGHRYLLDPTRKRHNQSGLVVDLTLMPPIIRLKCAEQFLPYNGYHLIDEIVSVYDGLGKTMPSPQTKEERVLKRKRLP